MDSNHDIVQTLRLFDGVMTGIAADEIEALRKRVAELEAAAVSPATADERACPLCEIEHDGNSCMEAFLERAVQAYARSFPDDIQDTLKLAIGYIGSSERADRHEHVARIRAILDGASQAAAPAEAREPSAWVTPEGDRSITQSQKQGMLRDGGAGASSVQPFSIACYAGRVPADAGEAVLLPKRVEEIMAQAQVFASAWSLVGGRFDQGDALETAEQEKQNLRDLVQGAQGGKGGEA
ncbi:hypothetical protein [Burkholderia gladioli]|uniref:hypothetical protein n=1 Tax=Burkholderia gladioli TaxID=28095 RepID=UPI0015E44066|nr:hypothetical protein [Burkholderia gladioli]